MNFNSFTGLVGGTGRNQIALQTLAATTETAFVINTDTANTTATALVSVPAGGGIAGSVAPLNPDSNAALLQQNTSFTIPRGIARPEFNSTSFDGRPFKVRLFGTGVAVANGAASVTIKLYSGTSTSVVGTAGNVMASTGAVATVAGGAYNFYVEATLIWDSGTQLLDGYYTTSANFGAASTFVAPTKANTTPLAVTSVANLKFLATATWGNAVGGTCQVKEFSLERL